MSDSKLSDKLSSKKLGDEELCSVSGGLYRRLPKDEENDNPKSLEIHGNVIGTDDVGDRLDGAI